MSADTQAFMALDRIAMEEFLMMAVKEMDDLTLKNATYVFISSYKPHLLNGLARDVVPAWSSALDTLATAADQVGPVDEVVYGPKISLRTVSEKNIKRIIDTEGLCYEDAWIHLRACELEDGDSPYLSEECEGHGSEFPALLAAVKKGAKNYRLRRGINDDQESVNKPTYVPPPPVNGIKDDQESADKPTYVPPPRVKDAEKNWPYMRCKNVARVLSYWSDRKSLPRSHHALLEYIADHAKIDVEALKKISAYVLFKNNHLVMAALGGSWR